MDTQELVVKILKVILDNSIMNEIKAKWKSIILILIQYQEMILSFGQLTNHQITS